MHSLPSLAGARPRADRAHRIAFAAMAIAFMLLLAPGSVTAAPLSASATTATEATASQSTPLPGFGLSEGVPATVLRVSVSTDVGTLSMANSPSGLTLASGYSSWANQPEVAFTGLQSNINAALTTLTINPGAAAGSTAHLQINAQPFDSAIVYAPDNGHYYKYVEQLSVDFATARTQALLETYGGQSGYLATIPSDEINDLIANKIPGAQDVWFGALAINYPSDPVKRKWKWVDGPLANTEILNCSNIEGPCTATGGPWPLASLWASGEPNNYGSDETAAVTNWGGAVGEWNDLPESGFGGDGYIVEFGDLANGSSMPFTGTATASASLAIVGPPGPPTSVTVATHGDKATVSWTPPVNNGGSEITSYTATASGGGGSCTVTAPATTCTIDGLTIGVEYTFSVSADNGLGSSGSSSPSGAATPSVAAPEPASAAGVTVIDSTSVLIGWTPSVDDGGEQVTYTVVAEPGGQSCTSTGTSCAISGLEAGREYTFSIVASNSGGVATAITATATLPSAVAADPAPLLTDVRFASHRVRAVRRASAILATSVAGAKKLKRSTRGTKLYFTSSEAATMSIGLDRDLPGRMRGGKCRAKRGSTAVGGKYCVIRKRIALPSTDVRVNAGQNVLLFTARIGAKRLKPGLYHLRIRLTDTGGNVSNSRGDWVRVTKR